MGDLRRLKPLTCACAVCLLDWRCILLSFVQDVQAEAVRIHWINQPCPLDCDGSLTLGLEIPWLTKLEQSRVVPLSLLSLYFAELFFPLHFFFLEGEVSSWLFKKHTPLKNQFLNKHNSYQLYFRMFLSEGVPMLYAFWVMGSMSVNNGESFILTMVAHALGVTFVSLIEP